MSYNSNCISQSCSDNCCNYFGTCPSSYTSYSSYYYYSSSYTSCYYYYPNVSYDVVSTASTIGTIIGSVIGGLIFICIAIGIGVFICKRRQQKQIQEQNQIIAMNNHSQESPQAVIIDQSGGMMGVGYPYQQTTYVNNPQMNMNYGQQPQYGGAPYSQPIPYNNSNLFYGNQNQPQYPQNGPIYLG